LATVGQAAIPTNTKREAVAPIARLDVVNIVSTSLAPAPGSVRCAASPAPLAAAFGAVREHCS
jgi:hypothetical protein